ncbi:MAG: NADH:flavin oxidoreductase [Bacteroidia bacterium]|nr:NADH:flavin oxidoreductase [Bacteroidia bacterium]
MGKKLTFKCGITMKNRFMLAPMTNTQSHDDGTLSDAELKWLTMRAKGEFGLVMTCASHVQETGKGFHGQLGICSDKHIEGHKILAKAIKDEGSLAVVQLYHGGMRSPKEVIRTNPVAPSKMEKYDTRALSLEEVKQVIDDFVSSAYRAQKSGYHGVEIHGAHGYLICQFLSNDHNIRDDEYGGTLENRSRILFEIVNDIRQRCGKNFLIGVRLSPERFGMDLEEILFISQQLINEGKIDFLDISLWDCFKYPEDLKFNDKKLLDYFTNLDLKDVKLTVAGKINSARDVHDIMGSNVDFVTIGRAAILHHDFPIRVMEDIHFKPKQLPVSSAYLQNEGVGEAFIDYLSRWPNFVV